MATKRAPPPTFADLNARKRQRARGPIAGGPAATRSSLNAATLSDELFLLVFSVGRLPFALPVAERSSSADLRSGLSRAAVPRLALARRRRARRQALHAARQRQHRASGRRPTAFPRPDARDADADCDPLAGRRRSSGEHCTSVRPPPSALASQRSPQLTLDAPCTSPGLDLPLASPAARSGHPSTSSLGRTIAPLPLRARTASTKADETVDWKYLYRVRPWSRPIDSQSAAR